MSMVHRRGGGVGCHDWSFLSKHRAEHFYGVLLFELEDVIVKHHCMVIHPWKMTIHEVLEES